MKVTDKSIWKRRFNIVVLNKNAKVNLSSMRLKLQISAIQKLSIIKISKKN